MTLTRHSGPCLHLAVVTALVTACDGSTAVEVPIDAIPLGSAGGQCIDRIKARVPTGSACLYFDNSPCVLVTELAAISTDGCGSNEACQISRESWTKYCPAGAPSFDLEIEAGQPVGAALYVLSTAANSARPVTFSAPSGRIVRSPIHLLSITFIAPPPSSLQPCP